MVSKIHIAKKYITYEKWKSLSVIIILFMTISSFIVVNSAFRTIIDIQLQRVEDQYGKQHFSYKYPADEEVEKLKNDSRIKLVGSEWHVGTSEKDNNYLELIFRDDNYNILNNHYNQLIEGYMPIEINEIAITEPYMKERGLQLFDSFSVTYVKYDYETGNYLYKENRVFKISGIIKQSYEDEMTDVNIGVVSSKLIDEKKNILPINSILVSLKTTNNIEQDIYTVANDLGLSANVTPNYNLIYQIDDGAIIKTIQRIINITIILIIGLIINNLLHYNFMSKYKDFGIMKGIGLKTGDLYVIILLEVFLYIIISSPIGIFLGYIICYFFLNNITQIFIDANNSVTLNPFDIILAFILILVALLPSIIIPLFKARKITPIEIIRTGQLKVKIKHSFFINLLSKVIKSPNNLYAIKNLSRNKKRTRLTIFTLIILAAITSGFIIYNSKTDSLWFLRYYVPGDYKIQEKYMGYIGEPTPFSKTTYDELINIPTVEKINAYKINMLNIYHPTKNLNSNTNYYNTFSKQELFKYNTRFVKGVEYITYNITAFGVADIKNYIDEKYSHVNEPVIVIEKDYMEFLNLNIGDEIELFQFDDSMDYTSISKHTAIIGGVVDECPLVSEQGMGLARILIDINGLYGITDSDGYDRFDVWVKERSNDVNNKLYFNSIEEITLRGDVISYADRTESYLKQMKTWNLVRLSINLIVFLFTSITLFNTIYINLIHRDNELTTLNAIGLTKYELYKSVIIEGFMYGMGSLPFTLLIQFLFLYFMEELDNVKACIILFGLNIGIVFLPSVFAILCYKKMYRKINFSKLKVI